MAEELAEWAEEASIMMENEELNNAAEMNGHFEQGPVTPPEPDTEPSTSILNGPPTEEEGTDTFIGTDQTKSEVVNDSDGEISSTSEKTASPTRVNKKRSHDVTEKNGDVPAKQAAVPETLTRRTGESLLNKNPNNENGSNPYRNVRRAPRTPEVSDEFAHPLLKTLRQLKTMPLPSALELIFTIPPTEVAQLNIDEMVEVLDLIKNLSDRRQTLTENRVLLTEEVRNICEQEVSILTDLEHVMTPDERGKLEQLRMCPPSMDELCPFDPKIYPHDVNVAEARIRVLPMDLLPPPETPLIGQHEPSWELLIKHIPLEFRGNLPPPPRVDNGPAPTTDLSVPPPNMVNIHEPPPKSQPELVVPNHPPPGFPQSFDQPPPTILDQSSSSQTSISPVKSQVSTVNTAVLPPTDMSVPPPSLANTSVPSITKLTPSISLAQPSNTPPTSTLDPISAFRQSIKPSLLNSLVNTAVPPPNVSLPPPNVNVPPPNVNVPPPGLDNLLPQGAGPHTMTLPTILQHPPPVPAPPSSQGTIKLTTGLVNSSSSLFSQPPPTQTNRPIPLMSIAHPPGFKPQISNRQNQRQQQNRRNKASSLSTPTQSANSPAAVQQEKSSQEVEKDVMDNIQSQNTSEISQMDETELDIKSRIEVPSLSTELTISSQHAVSRDTTQAETSSAPLNEVSTLAEVESAITTTP